MRPDLFRAVVAEVPFVDVVTTMLDPTLPLTVTEWEEWGNPHRRRDVYAYMKSYSPYDNVAATDYPALLRHRRAERSAGRVLGAGEVGGQAAGDEDRRPAARAEDRDGRRPRRSVRSLRRLARRSAHVLAFLVDQLTGDLR